MLKDGSCNRSVYPKLYFLFCFVFLFFLGPHLRHMEVPRVRGWIGAVAAGLHHSHSNVGSEQHLWPTPQLTARLNPWPTEWGQGLNLHPHGYLLGLLPAELQWELWIWYFCEGRPALLPNLSQCGFVSYFFILKVRLCIFGRHMTEVTLCPV